jgi:hypothetical protein
MFTQKDFIAVKNRTTKAEATKNAKMLAEIVIEDFYEHYNGGLIIPHLARIEYDGEYYFFLRLESSEMFH